MHSDHLRYTRFTSGSRLEKSVSSFLHITLGIGMKRALGILAAIGVVAATSLVYAASIEDVCINYETEHGWSNGYAVQATIISGSDLNFAVGSYNRFKAFTDYAVVFWDEDQASIFELPALSMGSAPTFETEV